MRKRKPLSLEETVEKLAAVGSEINATSLTLLELELDDGRADPEQVRKWLQEFCLRAADIRRHFPYSTVPDVVELLARRLAIFLVGQEPDIAKALGLKQRRGPKRKAQTKLHEIMIGAKVRELMEEGMSLDAAAVAVADKSKQTKKIVSVGHAKNCYTKHWSSERGEISRLRMYQHLLAPKDD